MKKVSSMIANGELVPLLGLLPFVGPEKLLRIATGIDEGPPYFEVDRNRFYLKKYYL